MASSTIEDVVTDEMARLSLHEEQENESSSSSSQQLLLLLGDDDDDDDYLYRIVESQNRELLERILLQDDKKALLAKLSPEFLQFLFDWHWSDDKTYGANNAFYQDVRHSYRLIEKILLKLRTAREDDHVDPNEIAAMLRQSCLLDRVYLARDEKKCSDQQFLNLRTLLLEDGQHDVNSLLMIAINLNDIESAKYLVGKHPQAVGNAVPSRTGDFRTPLGKAASLGQLEMCKLLVEACPEAVKVVDECNGTALSYAAESGSRELVAFFYEKWHGAVEVTDSYYNRTPLSYAAANGHAQVAKFLAEKFAPALEMKDRNGRMPLSLAAENGDLDLVQFLYDLYPDAVVKPDRYEGQTPLLYAAREGHFPVVKFLYEKHAKAVEMADQQGETALSYAARRGDLEMVKFLYEKFPQAALMKSNDSWCIQNGTTAGLNALTGHHFEMAQYLFENCPKSAEIVDNYGTYPLSIAVREKAPFAVSEAIFKANPTAVKIRDQTFGQTALSYASYYGQDLGLVEFLYEKFPQAVKIPDKFGQLPLTHAAEKGRLAIVEFLYEKYPAAVERPDKKAGRLPLSFGAMSGNFETVKFLYEKYPKAVELADKLHGLTALAYSAAFITQPMTIATKQQQQRRRGDLELVRFFYEKYPPAALMVCKESGETPALTALKIGQLDVAKFLFENCHDCAKIGDKEAGRLPLSWAVEKGCNEIVELLLEIYPDALEMADRSGRKVVSYAKDEQVTKLLLSKKPMMDGY